MNPLTIDLSTVCRHSKITNTEIRSIGYSAPRPIHFTGVSLISNALQPYQCIYLIVYPNQIYDIINLMCRVVNTLH